MPSWAGGPWTASRSPDRLHPMAFVGGIYFAAGTALYPRSNVNSGAPLVLYGLQYPDDKVPSRSLAAVFETVGDQGRQSRR